jgi:hypothetical protein
MADGIPGDSMDDELDAQLSARGSNLHAPATGSTNASRLLFPSERQLRSKNLRSQAVEDEEADTDIDESSMISTPRPRVTKKSVNTNGNSTPKYDNEVSTPMAPRFGPISPPSTFRATRSKNVDTSSSPAGPDIDEFADSPFHNWQTVRNPKKRGSEATTPGGTPGGRGGKRIKS